MWLRLTISLAALLLFAFAAAAAELKGLVFAGYQAWFRTSCDSEFSGWRHWTAGGSPAAGAVTFELYPDVREYATGDLCTTDLANLGNGTEDKLYAAGRDGVIDVHFGWMQKYGIDGVALQRFLIETTQNGNEVKGYRTWRDTTLERVKSKAEAYGRYFYVMIDISGANASTLVSDVQADVTHMEGLSGNPLGSPNYAKQDGKPVIGIWGCGFEDRPCTTTQTQSIIHWLKGKGYYAYGGIPGWWRKQTEWDSTYLQYDMLSPWQVGGWPTDEDIDNGYANQIVKEKAYAESNGVAYQTTMYPGFAWSNWIGGNQNMIPRRAGAMMWRQAYRMKELGLTSAYIAMFDEYDEGTAIAKAAENLSMIPAGQYFLTLDADGITICSDYYLRLAGAATRMIKGIDPLTLTIPVSFCGN
jgi:hypothetical protein